MGILLLVLFPDFSRSSNFFGHWWPRQIWATSPYWQSLAMTLGMPSIWSWAGRNSLLMGLGCGQHKNSLSGFWANGMLQAMHTGRSSHQVGKTTWQVLLAHAPRLCTDWAVACKQYFQKLLYLIMKIPTCIFYLLKGDCRVWRRERKNNGKGK